MPTEKEKRVLPPNAALDPSKQKEFNQKVQQAKEKVKVKDGDTQPGVVYLSHLPWGFEEKPIMKFLSQFGSIKKLRVSRSKKTGNSKGYAYIQFAYDEVATIVAETMNNYIMFGKMMKCKHLTTVHPDTFKGSKRRFCHPKRQERAIHRHNKVKTPKALTASKGRAVSKYRRKKAKLSALGIEYELEDLENPAPNDVKQDTETEGTLMTGIETENSSESDNTNSRKLKRKAAVSVSIEVDNEITGNSKKKGRKSEIVTEKVSPKKHRIAKSPKDSKMSGKLDDPPARNLRKRAVRE